MRAPDAIDFCNNDRVRAVPFFVLLVACLAASWTGLSVPAHPAHDSWWPEQRAPRGFVTVRVRGVPAPVAASAAVPPVATVASPTAVPALTVDMREEMLSASLAGLAALAVNRGEADELVWNDTVVQR